jgi:hypothetical protein
MKTLSLIICIILVVPMMSPLVATSSLPDNDQPVILLDVCSDASNADEGNVNNPAIPEYAWCPLPPGFWGYVREAIHICKPLILAFREERPPKV